MLTRLTHLALEVEDLDAARAFYADRFGQSPARETDREVAFPVGATELRLRRPNAVPRGGLHTHFAFSAVPGTLDAWRERLADLDPVEVDFGAYRSLYVYDPDGNCVEVGVRAGDESEPVDRNGGQASDERGDGGRESDERGDDERGDDDADATAPTGIFEVVLEVADLDAAVEAYASLGFDPVDRGESRRRVRLGGPVDLELWEPHLGLADARGGVHVDLGFEATDPAAAAEAFAPWTAATEAVEGGVRVRDGDGHWLTFR